MSNYTIPLSCMSFVISTVQIVGTQLHSGPYRFSASDCFPLMLNTLRSVTSQLTYPEQFPRHLTKRDTKWNHQDLQGVRNTIIHAQGHAPGTVKVCIRQ